MTLEKYIEKLKAILEKEGGGVEVSRIINGRHIYPVPRAANLQIHKGGGKGSGQRYPWELDESKGKRVVFV